MVIARTKKKMNSAEGNPTLALSSETVSGFDCFGSLLFVELAAARPFSFQGPGKNVPLHTSKKLLPTPPL
jgi:hypothetical protein